MLHVERSPVTVNIQECDTNVFKEIPPLEQRRSPITYMVNAAWVLVPASFILD